MRVIRWGAAAAVALTIAVTPVALAHDGNGLEAIGLSNRGVSLVGFDTANPDDTEPIGPITGLALLDTFLVGIDYRPQSGSLFGVGNGGGIYVVDDGTAAVTKVGQLTVPLDGTFFGIDFNPAANALRIVSDNGQNLRQPFAPVGDVPLGATVADTPLDRLGVSGAAYTNNDLDATTATQLFDIDTIADQLVLQNPPNAGTLTGIGAAGSLGDAVGGAGFDIFSTLDQNGVTTDNDAFAIVQLAGVPSLLAVNLADGSAEYRGAFDIIVADLAIRLVQ